MATLIKFIITYTREVAYGILLFAIAIFMAVFIRNRNKIKDMEQYIHVLKEKSRQNIASFQEYKRNRDKKDEIQAKIDDVKHKSNEKPQEPDDGKFKLGRWIVLLMPFFCFCAAPVSSIIFVYPDLPELYVLDRPNLIEVDIEQKNGQYILQIDDVRAIWMNEHSLKMLIERYEDQIKIYHEFRREYNER